MRAQFAGLVLAGAAALAGAVALPAASASAAVLPPLSVTVSPATVAAAPGVRHFSEPVKVTNSGSRAVVITTSVRMLGHQSAAAACALTAVPSWAKVSPGFTLKPGQSKLATFTVSAPASLSGQTVEPSALFAAEPAVRAAGTASVGGIVASEVILRLGSDHAIPRCEAAPKAAPAATSTGFPAALTGALVLALMAVLAVVAVVLRRRRTHRSEV
jgi:hypothetical protein